jgi:HEAT repeat protein
MRASAWQTKPFFSLLLGLSLLLCPLCAGAAEGLEPAFRLPVGGKAIAGPLVDSRGGLAAAWLLSEDRNLYLLSEMGAHLARIGLPERPEPFLALDGSGRALLVYLESGGEASLVAYTRGGGEAYRALLEEKPSAPPSIGSDGRLFIAAGKRLICLSAAGGRLWSLDFDALPSCPPAIDGQGRPAIGLEDGSLLIASPYGEALARVRCPAQISALSPISTQASPESATPVLAADKTPCLVAGLVDGRILRIGADGRVLEEAKSGAGRIAALAAPPSGPDCYALSSGGSLFPCLPSGSKEKAWRVETGLSGAKLFLFSDRLLVVAKGRALSYSLGGELFTQASFTNSSGPGAPSPSGLLFSPGEDWILGAYRFSPELGPVVAPAPASYGRDEAAARDALAYDPSIGDAARQLALLAGIEAKLSAGSLGKDEPEAAALAAAMAQGRFDPVYPEAERRFRANPLPRARAAWLLGRMGSPDNIDALIAVLKGEADTSVKAAAVDALAAIGLDPDDRVGAAFEDLVSASRGRLEDELALSLVAGIESLVLHSGAAPDLGSVRALLVLAGGSYGSAVRDRATRALGRIAGAIEPRM